MRRPKASIWRALSMIVSMHPAYCFAIHQDGRTLAGKPITFVKPLGLMMDDCRGVK